MTPFTQFVKEHLGENLIGIEIGTRDGQNAIYLLEGNNVKKLYLVDPFTPYLDFPGKFYSQDEQDGEYEKLLNNTRDIDNVFLLHKTSKQALQYFPENYFDFVYIDGDHAEWPVRNDMKWWDKVKSGGVFGGHDYGSFCGDWVVKYVNELGDKNKIPRYIGDGYGIGLRQGGGVEWAIIKTKV